MAEFQEAILTYPDGRQTKMLVELQDRDAEPWEKTPEFRRLRDHYGITARRGRKLSAAENEYLTSVQEQTFSKTRKPRRAEPLLEEK